MKRREPPEGWHPGYNCDPPPALECYCYADCMFDGTRWRIHHANHRRGTVTLYRDLSGRDRTYETVAIHLVINVQWHESRECQHEALRKTAARLSVSQQ